MSKIICASQQLLYLHSSSVTSLVGLARGQKTIKGVNQIISVRRYFQTYVKNDIMHALFVLSDGKHLSNLNTVYS